MQGCSRIASTGIDCVGRIVLPALSRSLVVCPPGRGVKARYQPGDPESCSPIAIQPDAALRQILQAKIRYVMLKRL